MTRFPLRPIARVMRAAGSASLAVAVALGPRLAFAAISGGQDPEAGISTLGTWLIGTFLSLFWVLVLAIRGMHLGVSGRQALPYIGFAVAGIVVSFGAAYWLSKGGYGGSTYSG